MREVRVHRGLTYGIHSRFVAARVPGPFAVSTFTRNETLSELHAVVTAELARIRREGITDEELAAARSFLVGLQVRRLETQEALAGAVAEAELYDLGLDSITAFRAEIERVDRAAAAAAIADAIPCDDLLTVLVGDESKIGATAATLGDITVVGVDFAEERAA
jgi:zinc protease